MKDRGKAFFIKEKNKGLHSNILFPCMNWLNPLLSPSVRIGIMPNYKDLIIIKNIYGQKNKKYSTQFFEEKLASPFRG